MGEKTKKRPHWKKKKKKARQTHVKADTQIKSFSDSCWLARTQEKYKLHTPVRKNSKPAK